jgi:hypothetical protein
MRLGISGENLIERILTLTKVPPTPLAETQIAVSMARTIMAGAKFRIFDNSKISGAMRMIRLFPFLLIASTVYLASASNLPKIRIAKDGRTFADEQGKPFVPFGVNYYRPGTGWAPQIWKTFDAEATRRDFRRMKELGVNCVRVFLT